MFTLIDGFENYSINANGEVYNLRRDRKKKISIINGYKAVQLYKNGKGYTKYIDKLLRDNFY